MDPLPIGKMAALNHISVQTLRYYDKIDLLKPLSVNDETGYRYYDIKQSAILDMIQYMKSLGMSLEQIKEQFDKEDIKEIQQILRKQSKNIDEEISKLHHMKKGVEACIRNYNRYLQMPVSLQPEAWYLKYMTPLHLLQNTELTLLAPAKNPSIHGRPHLHSPID